jgi:hypothetical protein
MVGKVCSHCCQYKAYSRFNKMASAPTGRAYWCKDCIKELRQSKPVVKYSAEYHLRIKYGLTKEQVEQMRIAQEGKCKICLIVKDNLFVDHNHSTKQVRGLLCHNCNTMIGHAKENPDILIRASEYLKGH